MRLVKPLMDMQISRYRRTAGPTPPQMMGFPVVLLTTVGAKTGKERTHVLGGFADGDDAWLVVASKGGAPKNPLWYNNLVAHPDVTVEVGNETFIATARLLTGDEREQAFEKAVAIFPPYAEYQKRTTREIPVFLLERDANA